MSGKVLTSLSRVIGRERDWWDVHYEEYSPVTHRSQVLSLVQDGEVVAALEWYARTDTYPDGKKNEAFIKWIVSEEASPAIELLSKVESEAQKLGCTRIHSPERFAFGLGWSGIPEQLYSVNTAFQECQYTDCDVWHVMVAPSIHTQGLVKCSSLDRMAWSTVLKEDPKKHEHRMELLVDDEVVGHCVFWDIPDYLTPSDGTSSFVTLEWIELVQDKRGMGWGKLLIHLALGHCARRGFSHLVLWADTDMKGFYVRSGFHQAFTSFHYTKKLEL